MEEREELEHRSHKLNQAMTDIESNWPKVTARERSRELVKWDNIDREWRSIQSRLFAMSRLAELEGKRGRD